MESPEKPIRFGVVMVEDGAFLSDHKGAKQYSGDRKGGLVYFAALKGSTREDALKEVDDALDYHGGLVHTHTTSFGGEEEYHVYNKWSHVFFVENVIALPIEEWCAQAEQRFWEEVAKKKEEAERAEYKRLKEKFDGHQEA